MSISLPADLLAEIDRRAEALGLNRSQYLATLARQDVATKGEITLRETPTPPSPQPPQPPQTPVTYRKRQGQ